MHGQPALIALLQILVAFTLPKVRPQQSSVMLTSIKPFPCIECSMNAWSSCPLFVPMQHSLSLRLQLPSLVHAQDMPDPAGRRAAEAAILHMVSHPDKGIQATVLRLCCSSHLRDAASVRMRQLQQQEDQQRQETARLWQCESLEQQQLELLCAAAARRRQEEQQQQAAAAKRQQRNQRKRSRKSGSKGTAASAANPVGGDSSGNAAPPAASANAAGAPAKRVEGCLILPLVLQWQQEAEAMQQVGEGFCPGLHTSVCNVSAAAHPCCCLLRAIVGVNFQACVHNAAHQHINMEVDCIHRVLSVSFCELQEAAQRKQLQQEAAQQRAARRQASQRQQPRVAAPQQWQQRKRGKQHKQPVKLQGPSATTAAAPPSSSAVSWLLKGTTPQPKRCARAAAKARAWRPRPPHMPPAWRPAPSRKLSTKQRRRKRLAQQHQLKRQLCDSLGSGRLDTYAQNRPKQQQQAAQRRQQPCAAAMLYGKRHRQHKQPDKLQGVAAAAQHAHSPAHSPARQPLVLSAFLLLCLAAVMLVDSMAAVASTAGHCLLAAACAVCDSVRCVRALVLGGGHHPRHLPGHQQRPIGWPSCFQARTHRHQHKWQGPQQGQGPQQQQGSRQ